MSRTLYFLLCFTALGATPENFRGVCHVKTAAVDAWGPCRFKNEPAVELGFNNRWSVFLHGPTFRGLVAATVVDYVKAAALPFGSTSMTSLLWGELTVNPVDAPEVTTFFRAAAPAFEIRPQVVTVTVDASTVTVTFSERDTDFNGVTPSADWLARHIASFQQFGRAH